MDKLERSLSKRVLDQRRSCLRPTFEPKSLDASGIFQKRQATLEE